MKFRGKSYKTQVSKIEKNKLYTEEEAIKLVKELSNVKFDATIEVAMNLNLDVKKADQQLRGAIVLPKGTGKDAKVLVIAKGDSAKEAVDAGADFVGDVDMIERIQKENWFGFDTLIATPEMMPLLGKIGKILGPKGLMPNPKTGTVTTNVKQAVLDAKAGKLEYRTDSYGNVHGVIGKVSFSDEDLKENLDAFVKTIIKAKPQTAKGTYVKSISICSTMSPAVRIDQNSFDN
ncbi:MAG: 50S ribosomal protein L1 [Bacilli bacterium]